MRFYEVMLRQGDTPEFAIAKPSDRGVDAVAFFYENPNVWLGATYFGYRAGNVPPKVFVSREEALAAVTAAIAEFKTPGPQHPSYWAYFSSPGNNPARYVWCAADFPAFSVTPCDAWTDGLGYSSYPQTDPYTKMVWELVRQD